MDYLLRTVMRQGFRRFRDGDHFAWAVVAACAFLLRRAMRPEAPHTVVLGRGESLLIGPADAPVSQD
jgi:hypothetical protein